MNKNPIELLSEENTDTIPKLPPLHKRATLLMLFNTASVIIIPISAVTSIGMNIPIDQVFLTATIALALSVYTSRWKKSKLRDEFEEVKASISPQNQPYILTRLNRTFNKRINNCKEVIGLKDFDIRSPKRAFGLAGAALLSYFEPTAGPMLFFSTAQAYEMSDSMRLQSSINIQNMDARFKHYTDNASKIKPSSV